MGVLTPGWRALRLFEHERPPAAIQVSLLSTFDLPTIPSSATVLPSPHRGFCTLLQPDGSPRLSPGQTVSGRREHRRAVEGSPLARRLPDRLGRIRFVILRTGRSLPVAFHPSSWRRSNFRLQVRNVHLVGTYTPPIKRSQRRTSQGREPLEWIRKRRSSREAATLGDREGFCRFAAKRPFPYLALGLTPQAILFRRFAASKSTNRKLVASNVQNAEFAWIANPNQQSDFTLQGGTEVAKCREYAIY